MKQSTAGLKQITGLFFLVVCLAPAADNSVLAQGRSPTSIQRRVDELNRQGDQFERDKLNADLKGRPAAPADRKKALLVASEVEKDLNELQAGYNQIVLAMAAKQGLDHKVVSEAVNEINKCSVRLKHNLALPQPNDSQSKSTSEVAPDAELNGLLLKLRKHLYDFVTNPIFESKGVLNVEQAKIASQDLDRIIDLSKVIKKSEFGIKDVKASASPESKAPEKP